MRRDKLGDPKIAQDGFTAEDLLEPENVQSVPEMNVPDDPFAEIGDDDTVPVEYTPPQKKGLMNKLFGAMSGGMKDKLNQKYPERKLVKSVPNIVDEKPIAVEESLPLPSIELSYPKEYLGGRLREKTLAERVRDSIKFPAINKSGVIVNGLALLAFVTGAYLIYAELPTHPEIVAGMVMISLAGSLLMRS